ncbi:L,D-transpeptidase Cds6 family protein [Polaromonas aquatica]|uniref:L,D-transpeptidase Cds6 family protein n=1 Tax=Polaromonas aquatica TaxID=332657 RepID=UPI003D661F00
MPTPNFLTRHRLSAALRMLAVAATLSVSVAHADDYADVSRLMRAGQYAEAQSKVDQYLASKPRDPQMRFFKGVIQTETGKTNEAIATFTKITEDYPELPEPYNNMAVLYAGQSQFDKARAALEMAIRTNPSYATAHENLGDVYARLASQAYSKALQLDGGNAAVPPKLALIRTLFSAESKNLAKPAAAAPAAAPAPAPVAKPAPAPAPAAPVAAIPTPPAAAIPAAPAAAAGAEKEVEAAVRSWAQAWSDKDMNGYLGSYGQNFDPPGKQARKAWEEDRRARIVGKSRISVKLSDMAIAVQGAKATARFKQDYNADSINISSRKTLEMAKAGDRWVIVKESTGG